MTTRASRISVPIRSAVLAGLVTMLTATSWHYAALSSVATYVGYALACLLLGLTYLQGSATYRPLNQSPKTARAIVVAAWSLVAVSAALLPFSIAPVGAVVQLSAFALLVATMHVHITHRWHRSGSITSDLRIIFWALALPVIASVGMGGLTGARLSGMFANPNILALTSAMVVALGLGLVTQFRRTYYVPVILISIVGLLGTETRTAAVAIAAAVLILAIRRARAGVRPWAAITMCFLGATAVSVIWVSGRIPVPRVVERFFEHGSASLLSSREYVWEQTLELWSLRPIVGYGFRVGENAFRQYSGQTDLVHVLNSYLQVLLEVGIVGFIPFAAMILTLLVIVLKVSPWGVDAGMIAVIIVGLTSAVTESFLFGMGQSIAWVFWLVAAAASTVTVHTSSNRGILQRPVHQRLRTGSRGFA